MIIEIRTEKPRLPWSAGPARAVGREKRLYRRGSGAW